MRKRCRGNYAAVYFYPRLPRRDLGRHGYGLVYSGLSVNEGTPNKNKVWRGVLFGFL